MKRSLPGFAAIVFLLSVVDAGTLQASLLSLTGGCKSGQCGECGSGCEPVITRPTCRTLYSHQRAAAPLSCGGCCDRTCAAPTGCGPCAESTCCAPIACDSVCETGCTSSPVQGSCCAPVGVCDPTCSAPQSCGGCTSAASCSCGCDCHDAESCRVIAELIHQSMTGCYATIRRRAIHRLGDHFDCCCHPEIMNAFVHALNDSDERVRAKAADEIGDQVRRNRCICGPVVISALRCALADCDRSVRREAEQSLRNCGYRVVDSGCATTCDTGCAPGCGSYCPAGSGYQGSFTLPAAPAEPAAPAPEPAPAPVDDAPPSVSDGRLSVDSVSWGQAQQPPMDATDVATPVDVPVPANVPPVDWSSQAVPPPAPVEEPEDMPFHSQAQPARIVQTSALQPVETPIGVK